jgi:type IV secretory pathway VirB2 component (pilin)
MKASTLLVTIALALGAYACDSRTTADGSGVSTGKTDGAQSGPVTTASRSMVRGEADFSGLRAPSTVADAVVAEAVSAQSPHSTADPLQNFNTGSAAPTMVIRTGQAFIEVEKVDAAALKIRQLAAQVGGFITNSSITGGRDQIRQATFELKIPAPKYDPAVDLLPTIGKVETVTSTAQDVGEEFVDVTARVTNSRRLEERLISLLANRTGKLDEVLRVERELARVREEIERYEGRLRYLSARVALSTLTITVHEPAPLLGNSPGENPIAAALRRAWKNFVAVVAGSIAALGVVIPLALLGLAGWFGYRRWKRQ